jgi:hypothetical protein
MLLSSIVETRIIASPQHVTKRDYSQLGTVVFWSCSLEGGAITQHGVQPRDSMPCTKPSPERAEHINEGHRPSLMAVCVGSLEGDCLANGWGLYWL